MIELKNINYDYKGIPALKDINLSIKKGDSLALIGSNGCGKSTLLKLLNALLYARSGEYLFDEVNITNDRMQNNEFAKLFHKRIGFIFQNCDAQLFCTSVYDEIAFAPMQMGMDEKEAANRVIDCMELLKIKHLKERIPYTLSGGEKKKVAIASVLSHNPDVLVLDEPMNGLDPRSKKFLRDLLIKLNSCGKTIICATHDFEYVNGIFKSAAVFSEDHRLVRLGNYEETINDKKLLIENNII